MEQQKYFKNNRAGIEQLLRVGFVILNDGKVLKADEVTNQKLVQYIL